MDLIEEARKILEGTSGEGAPAAARPPAPPRGEIVMRAEAPAAPAAEPAPAADAAREEESILARLLEQGGPKGTPLAVSLRHAYLTKRPDWYKAKAAAYYQEAAEKVRLLYRDVDARVPVTGQRVREISGAFLSLLKSDRSILLNLSYLPSPGADPLAVHAVNTALLSLALAAQAGYAEDQAADLAAAALLLDVGMVRVPEAIRNKGGTLTDSERYEVHKHPVLGADLLVPVRDLPPAAVLAIYQHHERLSGTGYPKRRPAHLIHDYSRMLAIADSYAAMVAKRAWRAPLIPYQAMEAVVKMGAAGLLDPKLIRKFLGALSLFPVGSLVRLDSGRVGKIIQANPQDFTRPVIAILFQDRGRPALPGTVLDLRNKWEDDRIVEGLDSAAVPQDPMDGF